MCLHCGTSSQHLLRCAYYYYDSETTAEPVQGPFQDFQKASQPHLADLASKRADGNRRRNTMNSKKVSSSPSKHFGAKGTVQLQTSVPAQWLRNQSASWPLSHCMSFCGHPTEASVLFHDRFCTRQSACFGGRAGSPGKQPWCQDGKSPEILGFGAQVA